MTKKLEINKVVDGWAEGTCDNCDEVLRVNIDNVNPDDMEYYAECSCGLTTIFDFSFDIDGDITYDYYTE